MYTCFTHLYVLHVYIYTYIHCELLTHNLKLTVWQVPTSSPTWISRVRSLWWVLAAICISYPVMICGSRAWGPAVPKHMWLSGFVWWKALTWRCRVTIRPTRRIYWTHADNSHRQRAIEKQGEQETERNNNLSQEGQRDRVTQDRDRHTDRQDRQADSRQDLEKMFAKILDDIRHDIARMVWSLEQFSSGSGRVLVRAPTVEGDGKGKRSATSTTASSSAAQAF